ncbi:MAG: tyrosine-type recombinase/integrase [Lachnospiraceae bacterium]
MREASIYASKITKEEIWPEFSKRFRNAASHNVYFCDINEAMDYLEKDFIDFRQKDTDKYYDYLIKKTKSQLLKATTVKKKLNELHKFSEFIVEYRDVFGVSKEFEDFFKRYAVQYVADYETTELMPIQKVDAILQSAREDLMDYFILSLAFRMTLKSTQIIELKKEDFIADPNGVYLIMPNKKDIKYVPEDIVVILEQYLGQREDKEYLFYNKWGRKLNKQYLHRMLRKHTKQAGVPDCSMQDLRNTGAGVMFAYGVEPQHVAKQMGITSIHIKRYDNVLYKYNLMKEANDVVQLKVLPPLGF